MEEPYALSAQQVGELIQKYLQQHPEIGGVKGLARKVGLSYDSVQKYAKGSNLPPRKKLAQLWTIIGSPSPESVLTRTSLFEHRLEKETMNLNNSDRDKANSAAGEEATLIQLDLTSDRENWSHPEERQEIFTPVHDFIWLYPEEVKIINHPAFQRLASMHQLGMANLVYRGATHRRFEHALGTVGVAQRILEAVNHNSLKRNNEADPKDQWLLGHAPTAFEKRFIRLAALLHDIGHVPYGHTIEDELHLLNKHDGEERLSKIFTKTTWHGIEIDSLADRINEYYRQYLPESISDHYQPADVLKRIIISRPKGAPNIGDEPSLAEAGLRIGICRDIVGDTICADLLDYLHRDWYHIGKPRYFDERILHYMEIRTPKANASLSLTGSPAPTADDVFVISIGNRPKLRTDGVSAILNLLESRYELAEAVLFHRTKMTATAMLERALSLAVPAPIDTTRSSNNGSERRDSTADLEGWLLDNPEEALLPALLEGRGLMDASKLKGTKREDWEQARALASRLLRRDLYKQLFMVTFDELEERDARFIQNTYGDADGAARKRADALRQLENDFNLTSGSIVMYCPESRMNKKIAWVQIFVEGIVKPFAEYEKESRKPLSAGHLNAQLDRFQSLWKIGFFINPEVAKKGDEFLSQLKAAIRVCVLGLYPRDEAIETIAAGIARRVVGIPEFHLYGCEVLPDIPQQVARADDSTMMGRYPSGAPTLLSFIQNGRPRSNQ